MKLNIEPNEKAAVLVALYNASKPQGMGFTPGDLSLEEARELIDKYPYFDYLKGRVLKIDLAPPVLATYLYDRDNGHGAALRALQNAGLSVSEVTE